jgi:Tol biopolymer transport system component
MGSRLKAFVAFRRPIPPLLLAVGVIVALALPGSAGAATPGKIAFVSNRDGPDEIYVMNADGSGQTRLTFSAANVDNLDPAWSPDGKQIAFLSNRDNPGLDNDLWIMNADGSSPRQVTNDPGDDFSIDWAPDGNRLVFGQALPMATDNFWLINADGSGLQQLSSFTTGGGPFGSHFSPDGTQIVFTDADATPDSLRLISSAGVLGATLTPGMNGFAPDFTGDGKRIVFYSADDGDDEIYSIAAAGGDQRQLTNTPSGGSTNEDRSPSPSRDGLNRIAFRSTRGGDREIYVMNADGSGVVQLTNTTGTNRGPDWQPTATCQGKVATIVGTSASETLTGGPNADIISGQGGKDQISGSGGKDTICGDAGKDKLNGGKGKDVLNGGKGNDKLTGGKGKDTCIGGKGKKDTGKSCEKEKKIP